MHILYVYLCFQTAISACFFCFVFLRQSIGFFGKDSMAALA